MRIILTLLGKDFAMLRRNRSALVLSFIVPMIVIYIVGLVNGLGRKDTGPTGIHLAVVNQSDNPAAQKLVAALQAEKSFRVVTEFVNPDKTTRPLTEADLRSLIHDREFSYALVVPPDLLSDSRLGLHLKILSDPRNDIESQIVNGILQKTIFSNVPQLLGQSLQASAKKFLGSPNLARFNNAIAGAVAQAFGGDPAEIQRNMEQGSLGLDKLVARGATTGGRQPAGADFLSQLVKIDTEQVVGRDVKAPAATRIVGGYAVMFLLIWARFSLGLWF